MCYPQTISTHQYLHFIYYKLPSSTRHQSSKHQNLCGWRRPRSGDAGGTRGASGGAACAGGLWPGVAFSVPWNGDRMDPDGKMLSNYDKYG